MYPTVCPQQDIDYPTVLNFLNDASETSEEPIDALPGGACHSKVKNLPASGPKKVFAGCIKKKKIKKQIGVSLRQQLQYPKHNIRSIHKRPTQHGSIPLDKSSTRTCSSFRRFMNSNIKCMTKRYTAWTTAWSVSVNLTCGKLSEVRQVQTWSLTVSCK